MTTSSNVIIKKKTTSWNMDPDFRKKLDLCADTDLIIEKKRRYHYHEIVENEDDCNENGMQPADDGVTEMYKDYGLYLAAINGNLDDFKRVLDQVSTAESAASIDILSRLSPTGNTFLHVAAKYENEAIVAFISRMKPSSFMLAKNFNGETALHLVAKAGKEAMVKFLVQTHRDLLVSTHQNAEDENNNLLMAENKRGNTALHEALFNGRESIAEYLIQQDPELSYHQNNEEESALYLAAKNDFLGCVSLILALCTDEQRLFNLFDKKSPIEAAIKTKRRDVLEVILKKNPRLIQMRDGEGRNPLHFAASLGCIGEARYLLKEYPLNATRKDNNGKLPIHLAASEGHVGVISLLLRDFPDGEELLDNDGCNILHVAAKSGKYNVFTLVLNHPDLDYLINMKDKSGNTPLHWASKHHYPKIVFTLTWNHKVDINAVNNEGMTSLDAAEDYMRSGAQFRQRLTWAALRAASDPRPDSNGEALNGSKTFNGDHYYKDRVNTFSSNRNKSFNGEISNGDDYYKDIENTFSSDRSTIFSGDHYYKDRVNTLLLVATLVATVTFAAGFTMPGGYNSSGSDTDLGMATMLRDKGFHVFVFCDTIAMYSSILVATILIWAQLRDLGLAITALTLAVPLLAIALIMMSMAFTAGVFVVVSKLWWLRSAVLAMGIAFTGLLSLLLIPLCTRLTSRRRILRFLSYYPFWLLILVTGS